MRLALAILALMLAATAGCSAVFPDGVIYPSITPDPAVSGTRSVDVAFTFEGEPVAFTVDVESALYAGASAADKQVIRFGNARADDWIEDYFPAFITEEHQAPFYDALIAAFRAVRDQHGLDADRYAELMTAYVQSITYRIDPADMSPKFPVETFVEGNGDCDDKTLLLGALLSREGYDVAVLMFEPEQHVALGIRSQDLPYRDTGYAFVETTVPSYIGQVPESLEARATAVAEAERLNAEIVAADAELSTSEAEVYAARSELESLKAAGRVTEYNARVDAYNALVAEHNRKLEDRNTLAARHNELAAVDRLVAGGTADRAGTYAALLAR